MASEFHLSEETIDSGVLAERLSDAEAGGIVSFEGRVRAQSQGQAVLGLDYEAYGALCLKVGQEIVEEAAERFGLRGAIAVHRHGSLAVGETAIWVGVCAAHRKEAFEACAEIVERIKHELPVWKRERYLDGGHCWIGQSDPQDAKIQSSGNKEEQPTC